MVDGGFSSRRLAANSGTRSNAESLSAPPHTHTPSERRHVDFKPQTSAAWERCQINRILPTCGSGQTFWTVMLIMWLVDVQVRFRWLNHSDDTRGRFGRREEEGSEESRGVSTVRRPGRANSSEILPRIVGLRSGRVTVRWRPVMSIL